MEKVAYYYTLTSNKTIMQNAVNFFLSRLSQNPIHLTILQLIPIIPIIRIRICQL